MYDDDDEFEDVEETNEVFVIKYDWPSNPIPIDWSDDSFVDRMIERLDGVTREGFKKQTLLWMKTIDSIPKYDEKALRAEIASWDFDIPGKDNFNFEEYSIFYSQLIAHRTRLTEIIAVVNANHELLLQANKAIKEMATRLATGAKHDKDGTAFYAINDFSVSYTNCKIFYDYLQSVLKNIEFCAYQMDRLQKEHQSLSRINNNFNNEGLYHLMNRSSTNLLKNNSESAVIKTRNRRLN